MAKYYDWTNGPAVLGPHSVAKHTILREYIERYVPIVTRGGTIPNLKLLLVDGFAGGGDYVVEGEGEETHEGSPLILINAVRTAEARINLDPGRKKPMTVDASYVFIEKNPKTCAYLRATLEKRFGQAFVREKVTLISGAFEDHLDGILARIKVATGRRPCPIFVLDQYGYSAIPVDMLVKIMKETSRAEVFLTLAVDHISAHARTSEEALARLRGGLGIEPHIARFVTGARDMEEAAGLSREDRVELMRWIQRFLHETFARRSGAACYTPFFITSKGSHRSYWFLHLANNPRANDVVKALHWRVSNHFEHFGREGTVMLGFDPTRSTPQISFDFGDTARDRTVRALVEELPAIIQAKYPNGVMHKDLYGDLCNETPADKDILGEAVNLLCANYVLDKEGAGGEERESATKVKDSDKIRLARRPGLFSKLPPRT